MAPEALDPKNFKSWEEAFEYPIPTVRGMEKQLRRDIDSNREKLRTLVGASYRDLLGTAESIISMDTQMRDVETYMVEIGKNCNTRILGTKSTNLKIWTEGAEAKNSARYTLASQMAVLRSCPNVISRILKSGGSVLLAAKVLVVSRLLHTRLSQKASSPPYLEILRNKLGVLRKRLLSNVDHRLRRLNITRDALVESLCAFSLATSSSAKDVLRHYHHIRQRAIIDRVEEKESDHRNALAALRLYVKTLKDTQSVIPTQLAHALAKLKSAPLLKNQDIHDLVELNLDVHERWMDDDMNNFTPYIRHDDLAKGEADTFLKSWARQSFALFLRGLQNSMKDIYDPAIMDLRKEIIDLWLSNHKHSIGVEFTDTLDGLRDVFNQQAIQIIRSRASSLAQVGALVAKTIQQSKTSTSVSMPSLWDPSLISMETSKGSKAFRERLAARSLGETESLGEIVQVYAAFLEKIEAVEAMIKRLRDTKWADDIDGVDNDEDLLDDKQVLLSKDDPSLLQDELNTLLAQGYNDLQSTLIESQPDGDDESCGQISCLLLRAWREIRNHLPQSHQDHKLGLESVCHLQMVNAKAILNSPLQKCANRLEKLTRVNSLPIRPLWEGDPPLPVLPSLWAYRLLLDLSKSMTACGSDVWSPHATKILKSELTSTIAPLIEKLVNKQSEKLNGNANEDANGIPDSNGIGESIRAEEPIEDAPKLVQVNGHSNGSSLPDRARSEDQSRDIAIQTLFDAIYLVNATSNPSVARENDRLISLQQKLLDHLGLELRSAERIKKDAGEYWKRTSLLFGLLA